MSARAVEALFEALFTLTDLRALFREVKPLYKFSEQEKLRAKELLKKVEQSLESLRGFISNPQLSDEEPRVEIVNGLEARMREELFINIDPIQPGGRLTAEAMKAIIAYGDGYSTCDYCLSPFRLDAIKRPPLAEFHAELAEFLGMDEARLMPGARRAFQAVARTLLKPGDVALVSSLAHYTEVLAIEEAGGRVMEVPVSEDNVLRGDAVAAKIERVKESVGKPPRLVIVDHFDYVYGNEHDVKDVAKVAHDYGVPVLCNAAYSMGVMPLSGREMGVDFLAGSGHKSFASPAPSGVLAVTEEWAREVFRRSEAVCDITGRSFRSKEVELLGCTLMGANAIAMMASFPAVKERVKRWGEELEKVNYFVSEFVKIRGSKVLSQLPRKHTLTYVDTTGSFDRVAKMHKRKGYFLSEELERRRIAGVMKGATKKWKLNTYGLTWEQVKYLAWAFQDIARAYGLEVAS
ncbi:MAG: O-phospho-L-seryl-tRNA:Cys-tRNA synthase [Candidatus Nezhaarchaeota archaeon]|nr:O-phospho-L-seryl-tRNA:Cys-tRNA synthase [Candidatus Nezhaarchaeota archaeon]